MKIAPMNFCRASRPRSRSTSIGGVNVRKVVAYELLSLDGVAEKPDEFFADWDDSMEANLRTSRCGRLVVAQRAAGHDEEALQALRGRI
jgi:hypothetical protein